MYKNSELLAIDGCTKIFTSTSNEPTPETDNVSAFKLELLHEAGKLLQSMCNDITNVAINESQQKTERMKIRAANQVLITKIEADSANFRLALEKSEAERANLIHCVCELMSKPDLPQEQLVFVKYILTYLDNTNPMNYLK